ncbi:MAG: TetR family transcriptional regulator [Siphonobacter sp.]
MAITNGDTEEKIKEAAQKIFLEKGFDGTTIRDIADAAQINTALTNYYFRSKEKLFWLVYEGLLKQGVEGMQIILDKPINLRDKLIELVDHMFNLHADNPNIALFLMNEIKRNPEHFEKITGVDCRLTENIFEKQIEEETKLGHIRPISADHLLPLMLGMIQQIFASKTLHMYLFQMDESGFLEFAKEQSRLVKDMVIHYLYDCK